MITASYSRAHQAFATVAADHRLTGSDVRFAVALAEHGGSARTDTLGLDLRSEGTAIRRSVGILRERGYVTTRGCDGGPTRPGVQSIATLTGRGEGMARDALALAQGRR